MDCVESRIHRAEVKCISNIDMSRRQMQCKNAKQMRILFANRIGSHFSQSLKFYCCGFVFVAAVFVFFRNDSIQRHIFTLMHVLSNGSTLHDGHYFPFFLFCFCVCRTRPNDKAMKAKFINHCLQLNNTEQT